MKQQTDYIRLKDDLLTYASRLYFQEAAVNFQEFMQGELKVLNYIESCGKETALPGELGRMLALSSSRVAGTLNSLEKKGYIVRNVSAEDRRKVPVSITAAGRKYLSGKREWVHSACLSILETLGGEDAETFVRIIKKLAELYSEPTETELAETEPAEPELTEPEFSEAKPAETEPAETELTETEPAE